MGAIPALLTGLVLVALLGAGCDRNTEPFVEGEKPRLPDLARIFPGGPNAPEAPNASDARTADESSMPSAAPRAVEGSPPGSVAGPPADAAGASIRGSVVVSPELASQLPAGGSLFVIARQRGSAAGPPLAVLRVTRPRFPVAFEIGPENVMIPSMRFEGEIQISARFDSDGDAMTQLPGDLSGSASSAHAPGASGVDILLDTRIPGDELRE
jgi:cytochrome c-type biogenesis protein CcmH